MDAMTRAQDLLNSSAKKIAQGSASPNDMVDLLQAKQQFTTGTKLVKTEDELTGSLLNILA
jgi:hypothetical protein